MKQFLGQKIFTPMNYVTSLIKKINHIVKYQKPKSTKCKTITRNIKLVRGNQGQN